MAVTAAGTGLLAHFSALEDPRQSGKVLYPLPEIQSYVQRQALAFFTRTQTGALVSRLNNDVIGAQRAFTSTLSGTVSNVTIHPRGGHPALEVELRDGSGAPTLEELGLLRAGDACRPLGELSPGQRRRVALAALVAEPAPLLLLDEPTNHLSLALAEELERALEDFPGTVVLATHDRWVRRRWRGRVLRVRSGTD